MSDSVTPEAPKPKRAKVDKVRKRQVKVIEAILGNPLAVTAGEIADELKVSRRTIVRDLQDPDVKAATSEVLHDFIDTTLIAYAMRNIARDIMGAEFKCPHCNGPIEFKGNVATSKWLAERAQFFPPEYKDLADAWMEFSRALAGRMSLGVDGDGDGNGELDQHELVEYRIEPPDLEGSSVD